MFSYSLTFPFAPSRQHIFVRLFSDRRTNRPFPAAPGRNPLASRPYLSVWCVELTQGCVPALVCILTEKSKFHFNQKQIAGKPQVSAFKGGAESIEESSVGEELPSTSSLLLLLVKLWLEKKI